MSVVRWRWFVFFLLFMVAGVAWAQAGKDKIIIDTDIGDDVDDAFALALAVKSPELQVLGVMTTFGDTETRAKITDRFLGEVGRGDIPVLVGKATATKNPMSQRKYAENHFAKAVAWRRRGVFAGADSEVSGRDHADCDWAADECGGSDR